MIEETIRQIEARLNAATSLTPEARAELLGLLAGLRAEAAQLPASERAAEPNAGAAEPESMQEHAERLRSSVEEFEESHPKVVQLVNHIANTLSGLGI
jgi:broad specificity phosphatase PhoE